MGRHLSAKELDDIHVWHAKGVAAMKIHERLEKRRARDGESGPELTTIRKVVKGKTWKRAKVETRGRKPSLSKRNLKSMDAARKRLIAKADSEREVHWKDVIKEARVPKVHVTTAAKSLRKAGYNVKWRPPRKKPYRDEIDEKERKKLCNKLRQLPESYWQSKIDLYMDNTTWKLPLSNKGKRFLNMLKVRGHLRTPGEGLKRGFTKPNEKKHSKNTGGVAKICAGIINGRVKIWHYLPNRWDQHAAVDVYEQVVHPALARYHV